MKNKEIWAIRFMLETVKGNTRKKYRKNQLLDRIELDSILKASGKSLRRLIEALNREEIKNCKAQARSATWRFVRGLSR